MRYRTCFFTDWDQRCWSLRWALVASRVRTLVHFLCWNRSIADLSLPLHGHTTSWVPLRPAPSPIWAANASLAMLAGRDNQTGTDSTLPSMVVSLQLSLWARHAMTLSMTQPSALIYAINGSMLQYSKLEILVFSSPPSLLNNRQKRHGCSAITIVACLASQSSSAS